MPSLVSLGPTSGAIATASSSGTNLPELSSNLERDELGDRVDEPRTAQALGLSVSDHAQLEPFGRYLHHLDGAGRGSHAAADHRPFERGAGRGGGGQQAVAVAEDELAVRADVQEQPYPRVAVHARGKKSCNDVASDIGAESGEHRRPSPLVHPHAHLMGQYLWEEPRRHDERRHPQGSRVDTEHYVGHGGVAGEGDLVDLRRRDASLLADRDGQLVEGLVRETREPVERARLQHDGADTRDHVRAEALLLVEHRLHRERGASGQIQQRRDHRRRPEVERDGEHAPGRVPRLDSDENVVDDHGRHLVVARSKHAAHGAHDVEIRPQLEIVQPGEQTL